MGTNVLETEPVAEGKCSADADLPPLLGTARRVKRALPPVRPSEVFQSSLDGELQQVARRLARERGSRPRIVVEEPDVDAERYLGLTALVCGLAGGMLGWALWRRLRNRNPR